MELQFDVTKRFDQDLERLSKEDQNRVSVSINRHAATFDPDKDAPMRQISQVHKLSLPEGLDSSLFILRASTRLRVILTIEIDPLFDRKTITLIRVVKTDELERAVNSIAESIYQQWRKG